LTLPLISQIPLYDVLTLCPKALAFETGEFMNTDKSGLFISLNVQLDFVTRVQRLFINLVHEFVIKSTHTTITASRPGNLSTKKRPPAMPYNQTSKMQLPPCQFIHPHYFDSSPPAYRNLSTQIHLSPCPFRTQRFAKDRFTSSCFYP
jgi:hypothetical protein